MKRVPGIRCLYVIASLGALLISTTLLATTIDWIPADELKCHSDWSQIKMAATFFKARGDLLALGTVITTENIIAEEQAGPEQFNLITMRVVEVFRGFAHCDTLRFLTVNRFEQCQEPPDALCMVQGPHRQWIVPNDNVLVMLSKPLARTEHATYAYELAVVFVRDIEALKGPASCEVYVQHKADYMAAEYAQHRKQQGCTPYNYLSVIRKSLMTLDQCLSLFPEQ